MEGRARAPSVWTLASRAAAWAIIATGVACAVRNIVPGAMVCAAWHSAPPDPDPDCAASVALFMAIEGIARGVVGLTAAGVAVAALRGSAWACALLALTMGSWCISSVPAAWWLGDGRAHSVAACDMLGQRVALVAVTVPLAVEAVRRCRSRRPS